MSGQIETRRPKPALLKPSAYRPRRSRDECFTWNNVENASNCADLFERACAALMPEPWASDRALLCGCFRRCGNRTPRRQDPVGDLIARTAMIPACTKLDQTVNQIRLRCWSGLREAIKRNPPSVA